MLLWSPTVRLYAASLAMDVGFFCAWAGVPFFVRQEGVLHLSDGELGSLRALFAGAYIFGTLVLARYWDRLDKVRLVRSAALLVGASWILTSQARQAPLLFVLLPLGGLALSAFWPSIMSLVGEARHGNLARRIGTFNCWWGTGKAAAYLGCGSLLEIFDDPTLVLLSCGVLMCLICLVVPRNQRHAKAPSFETSAETPGSESMFRAALVLLFVAWFIAASLEVHLPKGFGPALFGEAFGERYELWINVLLFSLHFGAALVFFRLRIWTSWPAHRSIVIGGAIVLALCQVLVAITAHPWLVGLLLLLSGATFGLAYSQSLYHAQAGREDRARRSGIHEGVLSVGTMTGAFAGGVVLERTTSPEAVLWMNAVVALGCVALVIFLLRRRE